MSRRIWTAADQLGFNGFMRLTQWWPAAFWLFLATGLAWAVMRFGAEPIDTYLSLVALLLGLTPFASRVRLWLAKGEPTRPDQLAHSAAALRVAVGRHWSEEAARREQLLDDDRMAVRWQTVAGKPHYGESGLISALIAGYRDNPGPVVVLGEAGSGKTSLCVQLTLELLRGSNGRIPVVFPLATWNGRDNLETWLVHRLYEDYPLLGQQHRFGSTAAEELLNGGHVLPILDGLDELADAEQPRLLQKFRDNPLFAEPFVLTCRTNEFATAAAGRSLPGVTVLTLLPMQQHAVAGYLLDAVGPGRHWQPVIDHLAVDPDGPLAVALAKPLMLYLARKQFDDPHTDPAILLDTAQVPTTLAVENRLLDGFLPAVYAHYRTQHDGLPHANPLRPQRRWTPAQARGYLGFLADHLDTEPHTEHDATNLSWWLLYRLVPRAVFTVMAAVLGTVGCGLLGWLVFGLFGRPALGIAFGVGIGLVGGAVLGSVRPEPPRQFVPSLLQPGELTLRPIVRDVGFGMVGAVTGAFIAGMLYDLSYGVIAGLVFGLAFALVRRFTRPAEPRQAVTPLGKLRDDRAAVLYAWLLGAFVGGVFGGYLGFTASDLANDLTIELTAAQQGILGIAVGALLGGGGLGMMVHANSSWGRFLTTRLWLSARKRTPLHLMTFLDDASKLGVLRVAGSHYQFRHALLQERLSRHSVEARPGT